MEYLLVVYLLMSGEWVRGDDIDGWGSLPYPTLEECLESKARGEKLFEELKTINPRAYERRFECEPRAVEGQG